MKPLKRKIVSSLVLLAFLSVTQFASAFYDPSLGRWLNREPLSDFRSLVNSGIEVLNVSAELNLFQFVRNEPNQSVDRWGLKWVTVGQDNTPDDSTFCETT